MSQWVLNKFKVCSTSYHSRVSSLHCSRWYDFAVRRSKEVVLKFLKSNLTRQCLYVQHSDNLTSSGGSGSGYGLVEQLGEAAHRRTRAHRNNHTFTRDNSHNWRLLQSTLVSSKLEGLLKYYKFWIVWNIKWFEMSERK